MPVRIIGACPPLWQVGPLVPVALEDFPVLGNAGPCRCKLVRSTVQIRTRHLERVCA